MSPSLLRTIPSVEKVLQALGTFGPAASGGNSDRAAGFRRTAGGGEGRRGGRGIRGGGGASESRRGSGCARPGCGPSSTPRVSPCTPNLGRAPLAASAVAALVAVAEGYSNLEYDLATGERGGRAVYLEHLLALVTGAEAATVVNNCAAALVLMLRHFTRGAKKEVIISRGELVQIGGGFRVPEIMEASGARLREVGTTNRTNVEDYAAALGPETALVLSVHQAEFLPGRVRGFAECGGDRGGGTQAARARGGRPRQRGAGGDGALGARRGAGGTNGRRPKPCATAWTWCVSAATSCSADRRPGSWSARQGAWLPSSGSRFSGRCVVTSWC